MAEAILFNVTADIIFKLGSSLLREFGSLWHVKDDLDKLEDTLSAIQSVLHDAEEQQSKNSQVSDWVLKLKDVLYEIDDLIDKSSYETLRRQVLAKDRRKRKQVCTLFSKFKSIGKYVTKSRKLGRGYKLLMMIKNQFSFCEHVIEKREDEGLRKRRETHSFILEEEVIGRSNDKEAVIDLLLNSNTKENIAVVSIVGMGGLGKPAVAQSIYTHHNMTNNGFQLKLWVCVSEEFDLKVIIQKIIKSATGKKPKPFLQTDPVQNHEIQKDELILLWRAQGFIQSMGNKDNNLIDIGDDYFMELLSRSFFQEVVKNDLGDIKALLATLAKEAKEHVAAKRKVTKVLPKRTKGRKRQFSDILVEKGLFPKRHPLPVYIKETINALGWSQFCIGHDRIWPNLVRAFYNSEFDMERNNAFVEGVLVRFSAEKFNEVFNMSNNPDVEGNRILEQPTPSELEDTLKTVVKPGSKW
ncbi:disease resistance protein RGA2-like [Benincasa hispida]|uniref:disease resistance protein RGA2-like n=1 Tax=Benincasa hispida TaxID=102211 RepID=UPI0019014E4B|nr:disease resistance protein RGA2-like [Benincasa hispida]